ncbi:uncharacterized protein LOC125945748 [Dermacentor silvarum]|uniref:uncharacterized protein LOC125945748 n=1 Tax=Dermacentor silvarum TaxID=543639 RepID=UPI002101515B|nr:uncharacterized protein LOC125945748 [Dermacentor silvarum]
MEGVVVEEGHSESSSQAIPATSEPGTSGRGGAIPPAVSPVPSAVPAAAPRVQARPRCNAHTVCLLCFVVAAGKLQRRRGRCRPCASPDSATPRESVGTEPGTSGTARPSTQQQPRRPRRQQQPLEDAACRAASEYARQGQLAEAANVEAVTLHQMLLDQNRQHHQQLVEELRASRVVQQQLAVEMRGMREATALIATILHQLVAALAHGLREPPQP